MRSNRAISFRALSVVALAVVGVVLVAGISPGATRFLTKKKALNLFYTKAQADPRYVNVDEIAANANLLDGQDSSAFLGANAKAADADLLDGQNSTSFMTGPGMVIEGAVTLPPFSDQSVFQQGGFNLGYLCPANLLSNGVTGFTNVTGGTVNLFIDNGSTNPTYQQLTANSGVATPTAAAGEFITYQVHSPNQGTIATIHVMTVHRASDCLFQVQAVISS